MASTEPGEIQLLEAALRGEMSAMGVRCVHPTELEYIRVTSLKTFELCPFTWAAKYLLRGDEKIEEAKEGYAAIGTAIHSICEDTLMQLWNESPQNEATIIECWKLIPDDETPNVHRYLQSLMELPIIKPLVVEERLFYKMFDDMPPISGQIDVAGMMSDNDLLILDHKSNRKYQDSAFWSVQLQQLLYAWMARKEWPGHNVHFRIGYANLGTYVQWETNPSDDVNLELRIHKIWNKMLEYAEAGEWPRHMNDECGFCELKDVCDTRINSVMKFKESFMTRTPDYSAFQKLEYVKSVEKIVKQMRADLETEVVGIVESTGGSMVVGGKEWSTVYKETRKAKFIDTITVLNSYSTQSPEAHQILSTMADDVFTVKVTGLDKVIKVLPAIKDALATTIHKVASDKKSLVEKAAPNDKIKPAITATSFAPPDDLGEWEAPF